MNSYEKELKWAVEAVRQAAIVCRSVQSEITPEVLEKKDRSPVTVADFASQALVLRLLKKAYPEDPVIAEESSTYLKKHENRGILDGVVKNVAKILPGSGPDDICSWIDGGCTSDFSQRFWTLDPVDGTKGFLRKEQYAISLALVVEGEVVLGALGCPNLPIRTNDSRDPLAKGSLFTAVKGRGAFQHELDGDGHPTSIRVSDEPSPSRIRFCESVEKEHSSHSDAARIAERLGIKADPVRMDSQAKYAMVARGDAEAYLRLPKSSDYREKIWDHAGGVIVVREAGGRVTDIAGRELDFRHGSTLAINRGVVVTNRLIHDAVIESIGVLNIAE